MTKRRKTIAEHVIEVMTEHQCRIIWYGNLDLIHEIAGRAGMSGHPLNINNRVLSALDGHHRFKKGYIKHIGRPARSFTLLDEK